MTASTRSLPMPPAFANTPCRSRICTPASCCRCSGSGSRQWPGRRTTNAILHHRRRGDEALQPALEAYPGAAAGYAGIRGKRRALPRVCRPHPQPRLPAARRATATPRARCATCRPTGPTAAGGWCGSAGPTSSTTSTTTATAFICASMIRPQFPSGVCADCRPHARALAGNRPAPAGRDAGGRRPVPALPRAARA